jgi:tartrate dehydrogenase/decarboxylase/D-malate dehydrogenase
MMLEFLGDGAPSYHAAHDLIFTSIEETLKTGPHTPDLGGQASTDEVGEAICERILNSG